MYVHMCTHTQFIRNIIGKIYVNITGSWMQAVWIIFGVIVWNTGLKFFIKSWISSVQLWVDTGWYMDMGFTFVGKLYGCGVYVCGEIMGIISFSLQIIIFVALKQMPSGKKENW